MKSIVLFDTAVGSLNQGDEIINISIKRNWPELYGDNYIICLASHTPLYTPLQNFLYKSKFEAITKADYKFLCGTNALYTNMLRPRPAWNINLLNSSLARNTICIGTGVGINSKLPNLYTRMLYKRVLSKEYIHSVRDEKTKEFLEELGFQAVNTGCPTLWGITEELCNKIPERKSRKVVFTLTFYTPDRKNDEEMIRILQKNYEQVYFWPQCIQDLEYLRSFKNVDTIKIVAPNLIKYDEILSDQEIDYVGNRLHGGIFAIQHARRAIIVSIDYRAKEMSANYTFPCIERNDISDKLDNMINSVWKTRINGIDHKKIEEWKRQFI